MECSFRRLCKVFGLILLLNIVLCLLVYRTVEFDTFKLQNFRLGGFSDDGFQGAPQSTVENRTSPKSPLKGDNYAILTDHRQADVKEVKPRPAATVPQVKKDNGATTRIWYEQRGVSYIFSAIGGNLTQTSTWDVFLVHGQYHRAYQKQDGHCCFLFPHKEVVRVSPIRQRISWNRCEVRHRLFHCPNPRTDAQLVPVGVTMAIGQQSCPASAAAYVPPYFPLRQSRESLAVCSKIAFGTLSSEWVIEWLETYKYLGVDKVITYVDVNLNNDTKKVLQHYRDTGFLEYMPYRQPGKQLVPRELHVKVAQVHDDKYNVVADCSERLRGYTYMGVIDFDEFIVPSRNRSLKQLMRELFDRNPKAAGFKFKSVYHMLTWGSSSKRSDLLIARYLTRTKTPMFDRIKSIVMPERVIHGGVATHRFLPEKQYKVESVPTGDAMIRHYRECRHERLHKDPKNKMCYDKNLRMHDDAMLRIANVIETGVRRARQAVFGSRLLPKGR